MSRANRRRIVEAPFNVLGVRYFGKSYLWAGVLIDRERSGAQAIHRDGSVGTEEITKFAVMDFTDDELAALL